MHKKINYINALPDFLAMQRVSFCWFITQGLTEELALFSKIYDFNQNTEYLMFSEEYTLVKPPYSLVVARKYSGNYRAQLVIPIEVRHKLVNEVLVQNQFPIINLPLMTTYATFIINGCERVIVSQIIRSPGIYFERNKNQKIQTYFQRKLSSDIHKLREFLPLGEALISQFDLFFGFPSQNQPNINWADSDNKIIALLLNHKLKNYYTRWHNVNPNSIYYYSFKLLSPSRTQSSFLQCFKFYNLISQNFDSQSKSKLLLLFLKWLHRKDASINLKTNFTNYNFFQLLTYFRFLLEILIKYKILKKNGTSQFQNLSNYQIQELIQIYDKIIQTSQLTTQLQLNSKIILVPEQLSIKNFSFLKKTIYKRLLPINNLNTFSTLRPILYFSTSLKDQFKYLFGTIPVSLPLRNTQKYLYYQSRFEYVSNILVFLRTLIYIEKKYKENPRTVEKKFEKLGLSLKDFEEELQMYNTCINNINIEDLEKECKEDPEKIAHILKSQYPLNFAAKEYYNDDNDEFFKELEKTYKKNPEEGAKNLEESRLKHLFPDRQKYIKYIKLEYKENPKTVEKEFIKLIRLNNLQKKNHRKKRKEIFVTKYKKKFKFIKKSQKSQLVKFAKKQHNYLKNKAQLLLYQKDHPVKTTYHKKYNEKELYTATLIPDYGSWIRFNFQKNTKLNRYKYPLKNQEDELTIQLDKITQKPILSLLKEMGLTDKEICNNLHYSDFFYFDEPLLINSKSSEQPIPRFNLEFEYLKNISEFSQIFDPNYYRIGKIGRVKINNRLNLKINNRIQIITYDDIFAIVDKLISLTISKTVQDDIDHLKNKRIRSIGELLQNLFRIGFQRLVRKLRNKTNDIESSYLLSFSLVNATIREFFGSSQLSQYLDQTNPLSSLTHRRRVSGLGPGGLNRDHISFSVRDIHPSHYGRICPIETPEGQNVGLIASLTTCARVNKLGFLETPFWRVINGKVLKTGNPIYLTAEVEDLYKIAPADIPTNKDNYLLKNSISVRYKQDFINVIPSEVDFIAISTIQVVSVAASLIPFFEHDDANRALMGSNMQRQSVPLIFPQKPIIGTGLENQIAIDSGMTLNAQRSGIVSLVTADKIIIQNASKKKIIYKLQKYLRSNQQTCINQRPIVWKGEKIKSGQILTDGPAISTSELSLGQNILVAYMPWQGYNFEDAILISERLVYDNIFTSIHIERYKIEINRNTEISEQTMKMIPNATSSEIKHLNTDGIVTVGTFVKSGDILVGKVIYNNISEQLPESKLLRAIFGAKSKGIKDNSYRMPYGESGRVIETVTFNRKTKFTYKFEKIYVFIAQLRKIKVGDKIAGRHGNKGIISRILARQDMPFLPDGTPVDIILNPLGVPSRMNVGQLYECLLGLAGDKLNCRFKILPFDEMYGLDISRILINKKLRQASIIKNKSWLFNPYAPGKMVLIDGRTGKEFENPITVGNAYMLKLIHLVDDKMHSRATGPYSLITQQPLRGKAQHGGQRFGEMEVWALEGFGAAFTLQEILTIKSDDMQGRNETLNAIVKGQKIPEFGVPESFKVLVQELRSIGLDMSTYKIEKFSSYKKYEIEMNLIEKYNARSKTFLPNSNINDISF